MNGLIGLLVIFGIVLLVNYIRKMKMRSDLFPDAPNVTPKLIGAGIGVLGIVILLISIIIVKPGEGLVNFNIFKKLDPKAKGNGIYLINPITNRRFIYSIRSQVYTMSSIPLEGEVTGDDAVMALSSDGLEIQLDVTVRYRLEIDALPTLHALLGPRYADIAIRPKVREAIRSEIANYEATETFSDKRKDIQDNLNTALAKAFLVDGIILDEFLLRNINLPEMVTNAIEEKKTAQQDAERMVYILEKEEKEAERKKIEAGGQAAAIEIIAKTLKQNPEYLNWYAINNLNPKAELIITDGKTILNLDAMR